MISLPNYGELSNWWRSHERKLLHERVIGCTNHLGECDINFHWAETLAVMSPFVAVPLATMSRVITAPLPLYFLSYFQERKLAPVNQRPPTLWNRGKLIRFPPTRRRGRQRETWRIFVEFSHYTTRYSPETWKIITVNLGRDRNWCASPIIFPPLIREMLLNSTRGDRPSIVLVNEVESIRLEGGGGPVSLCTGVCAPRLASPFRNVPLVCATTCSVRVNSLMNI